MKAARAVNSEYSSDCSNGDREAKVAATTMREWDRQHGWLHSPEERAADRREAEQELARVVAALRVWHAAATEAAVAAADRAAAVAPAATATGKAAADRAVAAADKAAAAAEKAAAER